MANINFTQDQLAEFKAAFDKFDVNGDNTLSLSEFKEAVKLLGIDLTDDEIQQIVNIFY